MKSKLLVNSPAQSNRSSSISPNRRQSFIQHHCSNPNTTSLQKLFKTIRPAIERSARPLPLTS
jgi:hypothetical protein